MSNVGSYAGLTKTLVDTITKLIERRTAKKGKARSLIREIKNNAAVLRMVAEGSADIGKATDELTTGTYERLDDEGYDFGSLRRRRIAERDWMHAYGLSSWVGKSTEQLVVNVYDKVIDLRRLQRLANDKSRVNWKLRARNILSRTRLLLDHIAS